MWLVSARSHECRKHPPSSSHGREPVQYTSTTSSLLASRFGCVRSSQPRTTGATKSPTTAAVTLSVDPRLSRGARDLAALL